MKKHIYLSIALIFNIAYLASVSGQQTYQSADYGGAGIQYLYSRHLLGFTNDDIMSSGADVTWNIRSLDASALNVSEIVTRDGGIDAVTFTTFCTLGGINLFSCLNTFNSTQQTWLQSDTQTLIQFNISDLKRFQRKTALQLQETFFGFTVDLGGSPIEAVVVYQTPDTVLRFPMAYEDTHMSRIKWMIDLAATGMDIQYVSHQSRASTVDAWGTLITPYDTLHDVLRVRAEISRNDTLMTDTLAIPINVRQVEYTWYDTAYGLPVMIANGIMLDTTETINSVAYVVESECAAPTWTASTDSNIYYIDDTGSAQVDFNIDMPNADVYTWDFDDGTMQTSSGELSHDYLSPGMYEVVVTGCMTNCLPLNSCTSQMVTFEVLDTTSAVHFLDPVLSGIRVFPNPVGQYMYLDIPFDNQNLHYELVDPIGALIARDHLGSGLNRIELSGLPGGLYLVRLTDSESGMMYKGVRVRVVN
jgi:hypothetical protein